MAKKSPYLQKQELLSPIIHPVLISSSEQQQEQVETSSFSLSQPSPSSRYTLFHCPTKNKLTASRRLFKHSDSKNKEAALKLHLDEDVISSLIEELDKEHLLKHYMLLVKQLVSGDLPVTNMAILSALKRAKLQSLKSTTVMKFHPRYKQFFEVVYRIIKGKGI